MLLLKTLPLKGEHPLALILNGCRPGSLSVGKLGEPGLPYPMIGDLYCVGYFMNEEQDADTRPQILVEPGNPFGIGRDEFAELVDQYGDELGTDYDFQVAYRDQVGAAVTFYEVVDFWLSWQGWFTAAQAVLMERLLEMALGWHRRRREKNPAAPSRPFSARAIVSAGEGKAVVLGEAKTGVSGREAEYRLFQDDEKSREELQKAPPPVRPWPPRQEDLPQRPAQELTLRRLMLERLHAMIREAQNQERETVVFDSAIVVDIGTSMELNAVESKGLFKRLVQGNYLRLHDSLGDHLDSDELHVEVEYLTDKGLREIGEL